MVMLSKGKNWRGSFSAKEKTTSLTESKLKNEETQKK